MEADSLTRALTFIVQVANRPGQLTGQPHHKFFQGTIPSTTRTFWGETHRTWKPTHIRVHIPPLACTRRMLTSDSDALFWEALFSVDITSAEGLSKIVALVHSPSQITMARSLRDDQTQAFVDLIDRVSGLGRRPSVPLILIMRYSSSRCPTLTRNYLCGAHNYFTRFAKPVGCYPPRMSLRQSSHMLVSLSGAVALQTSAKESTRVGPWPSNT